MSRIINRRSSNQLMLAFFMTVAEENDCHGITTFLALNLPMSSADNLYPDQARRFVWPDLDPNCLTL